MSKHPHVEYAMTIPGVYSEAELEALRTEIEELPWDSTIVEIGVLYGRTASLYMMASLEKTLHICLIDNWCVNSSDAEPYFADQLAKYMVALEVGFACEEVRSTIRLFNQAAETIADKIPDGIDLLHIDGNHHDPGPLLDCSLYLPKLKSGGVVVFHDYNTLDTDSKTLVFPGLHAVVDMYTNDWGHISTIDSQTIRRKP